MSFENDLNDALFMRFVSFDGTTVDLLFFCFGFWFYKISNLVYSYYFLHYSHR